jgi:hypothetical protein
MDRGELESKDVDWIQMVQAGSNQGTVIGSSEHSHEIFSSEKASSFLPKKR